MALRQPLDTETRGKLAALARSMPERQARRTVGDLSAEAFARALAGLPIQRGTAALIRESLAKEAGKAA